MSELYGTGGAAAPDGGAIAEATRETDSSGGYADAAQGDGFGGYDDEGIEAGLAAEDRLPESRTRQDAAAGTWGDSVDGNADNESATGNDGDLDAQLAMEEHFPESRTRQDAAADTWGDSADDPADSAPATGSDGDLDAQPGDVEAQLATEERLPESRPRQEAAAETWGDAGHESRPGHPDIPGRYPADYKPAPEAPKPGIDGPHEPPEKWIDAINPDKADDGRSYNCGDCSRSVDSTWHGYPAVAAAIDYPRLEGEQPARMTEWAGVPLESASMADIGQRLSDLGPGSSAIVGCDWRFGGGHWFNAINDGGTVKAVDGQSGKVEAWPPTRKGLGYDESRMRYSDAIFFIPNGKVAPHDQP